MKAIIGVDLLLEHTLSKIAKWRLCTQASLREAFGVRKPPFALLFE